MAEIPETMLSARQYGAKKELIIERIPVPKPKKGEVLVKILHSPINPSDLSFLQGTYSEKPSYPVTPGIEAMGIVVGAGKGILPKLRLGKRVSCSSSGKGGTWAEYMVTSAMKCVPLQKDVSDIAGSMLIVNPMTALAFIDIAKKEKHKAIVQTAANGALGKMMIRLCKAENIPLINIVRTNKAKESIEALGAEHIVVNQESSFEKNLQTISNKLGATLALDCIGGEITKTISESIPNNSKILAYAKLSESDSSFDARTLIQRNISIEGFYLGHWTSKQRITKMLKTIKQAQKLIKYSGEASVFKQFQLEDIQKAINSYSVDMSSGKHIISM